MHVLSGTVTTDSGAVVSNGLTINAGGLKVDEGGLVATAAGVEIATTSATANALDVFASNLQYESTVMKLVTGARRIAGAVGAYFDGASRLSRSHSSRMQLRV
jgi:hypothetical protein